MKIDLLFLTCNRIYYTKKSLPRLLEDPNEDFNLIIWDNGSTDGTKEFLSSLNDKRIVKKVLSDKNVGAIPAINEVFFGSSADLIGTVSDDLYVTPGWTRIISKAHADIPEFGMIASWHLGMEDFNEARARRSHKLQKFGNHEVLRNPWTNGGTALIKVKTIREAGPFDNNWSGYQIKLALKGYINGYYFPLLPVEHMDYPWSKYFAHGDRFDEWVKNSLGAKRHGFKTIEDVKAWHKIVIDTLLDGPWEAKYYIGWRGKIRNLRERLQLAFK